MEVINLKKKTKTLRVELPESVFCSLLTLSTFLEMKFGKSMSIDFVVADAVDQYAENIFSRGIEQCILSEKCSKRLLENYKRY